MDSFILKDFPFYSEASDVFELFKDEPFAFLLDSSMRHPLMGRYSFIGFDPFFVFKHKGSCSLELLRELFYSYTCYDWPKGIPFPAGIVGYLAYDYGLYQENIASSIQGNTFPDCWFGFYDTIIFIDHFCGRIYVSSTGLPEIGYYRQRRARDRLGYILNKLSSFYSKDNVYFKNIYSKEIAPLDFRSSFSKQQYLAAVNRALEYIAAGDIYQVNLSQRLDFNSIDNVEAWDIYKVLRSLSPSCFGGYLDCGSLKIISSSPERFICIKDNMVTTRPMKGTRSRASDKCSDMLLKMELENSEKEKAELLMITDLERNDIGKVCNYGSVQVSQLRQIEEYSTVFQATSEITGILKKDKDCFDVLHACFPGGSITGCPKIRAMQIINELEPVGRFVYTGIMGYIGFNGDMDFNILIRTLLSYENRLEFHVGGGIVADSIPEKEYEETMIKAEAIRRCLSIVSGLSVK